MNMRTPILIMNKQFGIAATTILFLCLIGDAIAKNNSIEINYLNIATLEDELRLDAEINYQVNERIKEALNNGITMIFQVEVQVKLLRKWRLSKTVSNVTQTYSLKYHALSKQYIWENLETGANDTFPDLNSALIHQGRIAAMYIAETTNLKQEGNYIVQIRSRLLTNKLPLPLRMKSYFSSSWRMNSGWYEWLL